VHGQADEKDGHYPGKTVNKRLNRLIRFGIVRDYPASKRKRFFSHVRDMEIMNQDDESGRFIILIGRGPVFPGAFQSTGLVFKVFKLKVTVPSSVTDTAIRVLLDEIIVLKRNAFFKAIVFFAFIIDLCG